MLINIKWRFQFAKTSIRKPGDPQNEVWSMIRNVWPSLPLAIMLGSYARDCHYEYLYIRKWLVRSLLNAREH